MPSSIKSFCLLVCFLLFGWTLAQAEPTLDCPRELIWANIKNPKLFYPYMVYEIDMGGGRSQVRGLNIEQLEKFLKMKNPPSNWQQQVEFDFSYTSRPSTGTFSDESPEILGRYITFQRKIFETNGKIRFQNYLIDLGETAELKHWLYRSMLLDEFLYDPNLKALYPATPNTPPRPAFTFPPSYLDPPKLNGSRNPGFDPNRQPSNSNPHYDNILVTWSLRTYFPVLSQISQNYIAYSEARYCMSNPNANTKGFKQCQYFWDPQNPKRDFNYLKLSNTVRHNLLGALDPNDMFSPLFLSTEFDLYGTANEPYGRGGWTGQTVAYYKGTPNNRGWYTDPNQRQIPRHVVWDKPQSPEFTQIHEKWVTFGTMEIFPVWGGQIFLSGPFGPANEVKTKMIVPRESGKSRFYARFGTRPMNDPVYGEVKLLHL